MFMHEHGGKLKESVAQGIFQQIMITLDFCLKMGSTRRDICPEHFLVSQGSTPDRPTVKLLDFSIRKYNWSVSSPKTKLCSAIFKAPEACLWPNTALDAAATTVYSCGVLLFVMLFGQHPFLEGCSPCLLHYQQWRENPGTTASELFRHTLSNSLILPQEAQAAVAASPSLASALDLVKGMLNTQPDER
jgi:serine/threonine protein kinase